MSKSESPEIEVGENFHIQQGEDKKWGALDYEIDTEENQSDSEFLQDERDEAYY